MATHLSAHNSTLVLFLPDFWMFMNGGFDKAARIGVIFDNSNKKDRCVIVISCLLVWLYTVILIGLAI